MIRPFKMRRIEGSPRVVYFKPQGVPLRLLEEVVLMADELEAIKLYEICGLEQIAAAQRMGISQSTFARILQKAYKKLAEAIVDGKAIRIERLQEKD